MLFFSPFLCYNDNKFSQTKGLKIESNTFITIQF